MGFLKVSIYYRDLIAKVFGNFQNWELLSRSVTVPWVTDSGPVPSWRLRGVRVDAGVATTVADGWTRAASVEARKRWELILRRGFDPATCRCALSL